MIAARVAMQHLAQSGVDARQVDAEWHLVAKAQYLKAIDWTIGLVKRVDLGHGTEIIRRLIDLRKAAQSGFRLDTLLENKKILTGYGASALRSLEKKEESLTPDQKDLAEFMKPFPDKEMAARIKQSKKLEEAIAKTLGVDVTTIQDRTLADQSFMFEAYAAVHPMLSKVYSAFVSSVKPDKHGMKAPDRCWEKQGRKQRPFYEFGDLSRGMKVVTTVKELAAAAAAVQKALPVLNKDNYYLENKGFNSINYSLQQDWCTVELQVKTTINKIEQQLSHDLIYKDVGVATLTKQEKDLVAAVIDVSTQLSMRQWQEMFEIPMRSTTAGFRFTASSDLVVIGIGPRLRLADLQAEFGA
jgi:hypothetical protein